MGCKCPGEELDKSSEIIKCEKEINEKHQASDYNIDSNSKKGKFNLKENSEFNKVIQSKQKYEEIQENVYPKIYEKNIKYSDYHKKNPIK